MRGFDQAAQRVRALAAIHPKTRDTMPRSTELLHPQREPVFPRPAATVLLLRDGAQGLEVLMTRRSLTASFTPGAYVFPGGALDAEDAQAHDVAPRRPTQDDAALTDAVAALRESFEEVGLLLAQDAQGQAISAEQALTLDRQAPLLPQLRARGWQLATHRVYTLARWITDRDLPKRFDVGFLIARAPDDQTAKADEREQFDPVWVNPGDALRRHAKGEFSMIFPTIRTLQRLAGHTTVQAVIDACASDKPLWISSPRGGHLKGEVQRFMESDQPFGELALTCPDGQLLHTLDWQHLEPVALTRGVRRLTAGNPGIMTGPGTNTYIIGRPETGFAVIDPGPNDAAHIQRIHAATGGDVRVILCTHSHLDHSPGAAPLQALCANRPDVLGLPSAPTANPMHPPFRPDRTLGQGELVTLSGEVDGAPVTYTLEAVITPGHAANHVCFVLREDGLLFSGDHVLNGSTTIVSPPDGNMDDYLASLDLLAHACEQWGIEFILPAHGHVLGHAPQAIAHLKAHRLAREAKVLAAMQALPQGSLQDWVAHAYQDTPEALWPIAARSLQAHVDRIRRLQAA
jgi:glyoxylase-like metal-dependent hydrolase (beta-lactamase superfamily II)/8-oxo-dGTP pyrophosphatase MutT (NUDIX family)